MKTFDKKQVDVNGFWSIEDNPISKVGVFPYLGSEIGAPEPDKVYMVYRPEEELSNPETLASFNLLPFIDDHEFLGVDGTPAEKKGVQGTTGENATFDYPYLKNNLRVYSNFLQNQIVQGKKELSPSYRCDYEFTSGVFGGQKYDAIQRNLRGNHLALVDKGRTGPDVAVLDRYPITNDSAEFIAMEFTPEQLEQLRALIREMLAEMSAAADETKEEETQDQEDPVTTEEKDAVEEVATEAEAATELIEAAAEAVEEAQTALEEVQAAAEEVKEAPTADSVAKLNKAMAKLNKVKVVQAKAPALDSATVIKQIAARDALAERLKKHVGVFDYQSMTSAHQVAKYGVKKLGIRAADGAELAVLEGYLQAAKPETVVTDSKPRGSDTATKLWS